MSPYLAAGVLSVRESLAKVKEYNKGSSGFSQYGCCLRVSSWVREIVFRELYRPATVTTLHTSMNLPEI